MAERTPGQDINDVKPSGVSTSAGDEGGLLCAEIAGVEVGDAILGGNSSLGLLLPQVGQEGEATERKHRGVAAAHDHGRQGGVHGRARSHPKGGT